MSNAVEGVEKQSKPKVKLGVKHVTCLEDAACGFSSCSEFKHGCL